MSDPVYQAAKHLTQLDRQFHRMQSATVVIRLFRGPLLAAGIVCGALTLLAIGANVADHNFSLRLANLLAQYDDATKSIVEFLQIPVVASAIKWSLEYLRDNICQYPDYAGSICDLRFELHKDWTHILQILSLYFANSWKNNLRHRPINARMLIVPYLVLATFGAIGFGLFVTSAPAIAAVFPTATLVLSEIAEAVSTSRYYSHNNQPFRMTFAYYIKETVRPRFALFAVLNVVGAITILTLPLMSTVGSNPHLGPSLAEPIALVLPITYVFSIALWLLFRAYQVTAKDAPSGERMTFFRTRHSTRLAVTILGVFALALSVYFLDELVAKA